MTAKRKNKFLCEIHQIVAILTCNLPVRLLKYALLADSDTWIIGKNHDDDVCIAETESSVVFCVFDEYELNTTENAVLQLATQSVER